MIMEQAAKRTDRRVTWQGRPAVLAAVVAVLLLLPGNGIAETYSWTDKDGSLHIVDDPSKVPPEYRKTPIDEKDDALPAQRPRTGSPDARGETSRLPSVSYGVSGSWVEKENAYDFRDDSLVFQLEPDGTGYSIGTRFMRTVRMSITWSRQKDGGIEIAGFRNGAKQEKAAIVYDRSQDELTLIAGGKTMRRMKRSLPATRAVRASGEAPLAGLWSTSETEHTSNTYFSIERDGTGIMFAKSGYYYFAPFSWKITAAGIELAFQVVSADGTEGASAQRGMKDRTVTMQYDDNADMLSLRDGKTREGLFRTGEPLFRGAGAPAGTMRKLEKRDGLVNIAKQGNASAALIVAQYYLYNTQESRPEGFNLLCRAAEAGNAEAQYMRGLMQYFGKNAPVNKKEGLKWIRTAVKADHPGAVAFLDRIEQREKNGSALRHDLMAAAPSQDIEVRQLISDLAGPDPTVRQRAAVQLGSLMATEAVDQLSIATGDPHFPVQKAAIYALGLISDPRSVPALIAAANNQQEAIRTEAISALRKTGQPAAELLGAAINDAKTPVPVKQAMCMILAEIGDRRSAAPLIKALQTSEVAAHAAQALAAIGDVSAVPPLVELLSRTGNAWAGGRGAAVMTLEQFGGPAAIDALILRLDDENTASSARSALIRMSRNDPQVIRTLVSIMRGKKKIKPRMMPEAAHVLINMGEAGKEQLVSCARDSTCEGRSSAEYILVNERFYVGK